MNAPLIARQIPAEDDIHTEQPLAGAVRDALERYFEQLDGHEPDDLYRMVMEEVERPLLECVMLHCGGNQTRASEHLGINRGTLRKKLKQYALD